MKHLKKIVVATDLSETSRRGLRYACALASDQKAALMVLHVANEFTAREYYPEEFAFAAVAGQTWPRDRILAEASLDLIHFLQQNLESMKPIPVVTRRVVFGPVARGIAAVATEEKADLIVISPRRHNGLRRLFGWSITANVTRLSPCPVLAVTSPLPSRLRRHRWLSHGFGWPRERATAI
jgi:nucleotide-binding universal stress UspA family protein